jgi:hypothetical protein
MLTAIIVAAIILIAAILAYKYALPYLHGAAATKASKEGYGPPPGLYRALTLEELGPDRGWPSYPLEYEANTASAISGLIRRSA